MSQVRGHPVQEAEVCVGTAPGKPEDSLPRELQVRGPREVPCKPGSHHAAAGRGVLEVSTFRPIIPKPIFLNIKDFGSKQIF